MPIESFVIFVDILGFADLVMDAGELGVLTLSPTVRPTPDKQLASYMALAEADPLARTFGFFHQCIEEFLPRVHQGMSGGTSLVFSDSAFFQKHDAEEAARIAIDLMREMIGNRVPVRIGVAKGEMRILRFQSDSFGWNINHSTQFLGPGVVRAARTEGCGARGLRILVDPFLEPDLTRLKLPMVELTVPVAKWPVTKELNYLWSPEEFEATKEQTAQKVYKELEIFEAKMLTSRINDMRREAKPDKQSIYDETAAALTRMREQFGRPPVVFSMQ